LYRALIKQIPVMMDGLRMVVTRPDHGQDVAIESEATVEDHAKYRILFVRDRNKLATEMEVIADNCLKLMCCTNLPTELQIYQRLVADCLTLQVSTFQLHCMACQNR